jgi:histidine ammonia-lyase
MTNSIQLDGSSLSIEQVIQVSSERISVKLTHASVKKVERAAQAVQELLARGEIAYGITTGFGAFKDRIISPDQVETLQRNIIVSHAVGAGEPFDIPTTRAIMLIRANTLAHGHSGIRVTTLQLLLEMLNRGVHPCIPEKGSLGASGDLAPLAHMTLVMIGEGEAEYQGETMTGREALRRAGLEPVRLAAKEGLALTN